MGFLNLFTTIGAGESGGGIVPGQNVRYSLEGQFLDYVAFGTLFPNGANNQTFITRNGSDHFEDGEIFQFDISTTTGQVTNRGSKITDAQWNLSYGNTAVLGNRWAVFTTHYDGVLQEFVDIGYYVSTDGGQTYGSFTSLKHLTSRDRYDFFAPPIQNDAGDFFISWFEHTGGSQWRLNYFKSSDLVNFTNVNVYDGPSSLGEGCFLNIGNNEILCVIRKNSEAALYMTISEDGGATWWNGPLRIIISPELEGVGNAALCLDSVSGLVHMVYMDRGNNKIFVSKNNSISSIKSRFWNTPTEIFQAGSIVLGYPQINQLGPDNFLITFSDEVDGTPSGGGRADLIYRFGPLP